MRRYVSVLYHHNFSNLLPLLLCGIGTSWIMGACMQNKDGVLWTALGETERRRSAVNSQSSQTAPQFPLTQSLPPGHQGNQPSRGPSSLRPSTCKDGYPQSQRWQIQHCDFLKQTVRKCIYCSYRLETNFMGVSKKIWTDSKSDKLYVITKHSTDKSRSNSEEFKEQTVDKYLFTECCYRCSAPNRVAYSCSAGLQ